MLSDSAHLATQSSDQASQLRAPLYYSDCAWPIFHMACLMGDGKLCVNILDASGQCKSVMMTKLLVVTAGIGAA